MKNYTVSIDTNTTSQNIGKFDTLEEARKIAIEYLEDTDPENDSEGINIYTEEGMVMSYSKGQEPVAINPKNGMSI